ncbi:MAG: PAS domain-containing protein, partial [Bradyrhizobium sp.]|uniref:PAS domain-containing protein n=1 Tax=Bradyrhizobium sp. TaxID=376 RepID=UPI003D126C0D
MLQLNEYRQSPQPPAATPFTSAAVLAAALNALPLPVIIVDAELQVLHINAAASELTTPGCSGLTVGQACMGGTYLRAQHRDDDARLRRLVARASAGEPGGAVRVREHHEDPLEEATLAVQVGPVPMHFAIPAGVMAKGLAMISARELARPTRVEQAVLGDLYGLTRAEADVAGALAGGVTAEEVARTRHVALDTIRAQVRAVLRKTNAANLRDFERISA